MLDDEPCSRCGRLPGFVLQKGDLRPVYEAIEQKDRELAALRKALAAAEEMRRKAASSKNRAAMAAIEAFDAAMAEVRKGEG